MASVEDRLAALEDRVRRAERLIRGGRYLDRAIRHWRAVAPPEMIGVIEGETVVAYGDIYLYNDMDVAGDWVIADIPRGGTNAAGFTAVLPPEVQ